jgi:hypothetical protein
MNKVFHCIDFTALERLRIENLIGTALKVSTKHVKDKY